MSACPFCGSENKLVNTPYVSLGRSGKYEAKKSYCCKSQRENVAYLEKRYGRDDSRWPEKDPSKL